MSESNRNRAGRKYPVFVRLLGILLLIGIGIGNVLLFSKAYPVNLQWMVGVGLAVLVFSSAVWLVAKMYSPKFDLSQRPALRLLLAALVLLISTIIFYALMGD